MDFNYAIAQIQSEWEPETGFFWKLRQGIFETADLNRALAIVSSLPILTDDFISTRLVSVIWYIPIFMEWQTGRVREHRGNTSDYSRAITEFTHEIERILGTP